MRSLFVIHASIWDMIVLGCVGAFVVCYFIIWAGAAWQSRKEKKQ